MADAIETKGLGRRFGSHVAVDGVDLAVPEQSVYGFLGQNGAGKTTTIRLLLGLLRADAGSASIFGFDVRTSRRQAARLIGALVETPSHYDHLTGRQNLEITRRLLGSERGEIDRVLELVDLFHSADRRVGGYSLGMRQRLGVARALIGRPKLLILDEPTNGLDPHGIRDMRALIAALPEREGVTVFVSSHVLAEVEQTATHVGLMHRGRLMLQSPIEALKASQRRSLRLTVDRPDAAAALLAKIGLEARLAAGGRLAVEWNDAAHASAQIAEINRGLVECGFAVSGIELVEPSLEDIFVANVGADAVPAAEPQLLAA